MILNRALSETARGESFLASSGFRCLLAILGSDSIVTWPSTLVWDTSCVILCPDFSLLRRTIVLLD